MRTATATALASIAVLILGGFAASCGGSNPPKRDRPPPASSCKQILELNPDIESGEYRIDPDRSGDEFEPFEVQCDMETDGGGWTKLTPCIAKNELGATLVAGMKAGTEKFDDQCRPWTTDDRKHSYHYNIPFAGGFQEFYLENYKIKNPTDTPNQLGFRQEVWVKAFGAAKGDVSFGSGAFQGPETSFTRHAAECGSGKCVVDWPANKEIYDLGESVDNFRIGWGESSVSGPSPEPNPEGWYPWWKGAIWVR